MTGNKIRLFKIATEINIGRDNIVDFLKSQGFDIENKPTSELTPEMVNIISEKFKKEKKAHEKQIEKLEKHKQIRKATVVEKVVPKATDEPVPNQTEPDSVVEDAPKPTFFNDESAKNTNQKPNGLSDLIQRAVSMDDTAKNQQVIESKNVNPEVSEPESVINIAKSDELAHAEVINEPNKSIETGDVKDNDANVDIENQNVKNNNMINETPATEEIVDSDLKEERVISKEEAEQIALAKYLQEQLTMLGKNEEKPTTLDDFENKEVETPDDMDSTLSKDAAAKKKKKKKKKKLIEVEPDMGEAPKLKGLTIVGRIELHQVKEEIVKKELKKAKNKPLSAEEEEEAKNKVKGKFKKKVKVKIKEKEVVDKKVPDKKKKKKHNVRELITDEDIDKAIKQTLSEMEESSFTASRSRMRQKKRLEREEKEHKRMEEQQKEDDILKLTEFVSTADLASMIGVSPNEIILKCMGLGLMVSINQRLDKDTITLIADDYGVQVEFYDEKSIQAIEEEDDPVESLKPRPPIVTIMGHVDHGKTSLLDYIRNANVVAGEYGGITQHIGAYRVKLPNNKYITFLDTPGHEAFTAMRARGAQVTDIVILVVAADDSVMPQTIEAISHAQAANVPIVVAINKIDKPDAQPDRIKQQLADYNVLVEDWGGKYQSVEISAKKGINVDSLLEKISLEAELLELKANPDRTARAPVIEANMNKGLGPVATVIVQKGTLKIGDPFVSGSNFGKVRALFDERGNKVDIAEPSMPVRVIGFNGLPEAGDILNVVGSDTEARAIATQRLQLKRIQDFKQTKHVTLDDISQQIQKGSIKELNLIIKGDVGGSVEALSDSLLKLSHDEVRVAILHKGVGSISESDVMLAVASGAVIIGFQTNPSSAARKLAEKEAVDIRSYNIIYDCINEVKLALEGLLTPDIKEDVTSQVEVRKVFKISKFGSIAGCFVLSGKIVRNDKVRLVRAGLPVFSGSIHSLKRGKDDVREVDTSYECGVALEGYNDIQIGDIIESYKITEVKRTLDI